MTKLEARATRDTTSPHGKCAIRAPRLLDMTKLSPKRQPTLTKSVRQAERIEAFKSRALIHAAAF